MGMFAVSLFFFSFYIFYDYLKELGRQKKGISVISLSAG